jgi:hypothetical protein
VFAQGTLAFVHADVLFCHVRFDYLAIVNKQTRLALDELAEPAVRAGNLGDEVVQHELHAGCNHATEQRSIRPGHRILHGIADQ